MPRHVIVPRRYRTNWPCGCWRMSCRWLECHCFPPWHPSIAESAAAVTGLPVGKAPFAMQSLRSLRSICQIAWNTDPHFASNSDPLTSRD
jgi:hypothetical protein